ncbi:protein neuralized isoform X2 [Lepeophtheirus salmonis]|uniref:protein neuralized isoform X2 n=1 Tax=Lepeophtheirus salmonis TaxID=72036 RepID=UPI001AE7E04C|nr:protein neuralized-like isoform X2 [Lepeophtheirus salmonis]
MGQGQSGLKRESRRLQEYDPAPLDLPPLRFHETRGENIGLFSEGFIAKRVESFCKGIVFSQRPVRIGERVVIRLSGLSSQWTGVLRVGFTNVDPSTLTSLPRYACPDLTTKPGFWAKALSRFATDQAAVHYFVTHNGNVYIGASGDDLEHFFNGVDAKKPLWAMIDLYGNCTTIELVDIRRQIHNNLNPRPLQPQPTLPPPIPPPIIAAPLPQPPVPLTSSHNVPRTQLPPQEELNLIDHTRTLVSHKPLLFHNVTGRNVHLSPTLNTAWRHEDEFAQGYVFSSIPLRSCSIVVKILGAEPSYIGSLAVGFTNVNPSNIDSGALPEDSNDLLERNSEYWVVCKDIANSPSVGDELKFDILRDGVVTLSFNNGPSHVIMKIDTSKKLWGFWDIYGHTSKIQIRGTVPESRSMVVPSEFNGGSLGGPPPSLQCSDCTICYEKPANSVIYTCGHICMCFECAVQQWKGRGGGFCPMCRQPIIDVIKTFRS